MLAARNWNRPPLIIWNPVDQYLLETGRTCFKGMQFGDLRRMQLDIETDCSPATLSLTQTATRFSLSPYRIRAVGKRSL